MAPKVYGNVYDVDHKRYERVTFALDISDIASD